MAQIRGFSSFTPQGVPSTVVEVDTVPAAVPVSDGPAATASDPPDPVAVEAAVIDVLDEVCIHVHIFNP